jgi:hypothetical protein
MADDNPVASFKIPNHAPGPHPVWKPNPVPATTTNETGLRVTLESFASDVAQNRTRCVFRVLDGIGVSDAWDPTGFELSDATESLASTAGPKTRR